MDCRRIAVLKPSDTGWEAFLQDVDALSHNGNPNQYNEDLDDAIADQVETIREEADALGLDVSIEEYDMVPLFRRREMISASRLLSARKTRRILASDIIVTVDPAPQVLAYIMAGVSQNALLRGIVGFRDTERFEQSLSLMQRSRISLYSPGGNMEMIPKVFPVPLNGVAAAGRANLQNALLFPHIKGRQAEAEAQIAEPREDEKRHLRWEEN